MNKTYKTIRRFSYFLLAVLSSLYYLNIAIAQEGEDEEVGIGNLSNVYDFQALGGMESRLVPHGDDLMGDMIDKNTGGVSFEHTDVVIPGNFNIEVGIRRKLSQGETRFTPYQQGFGDWVLDLPIAYSSYATSNVAPRQPVFDGGCLNDYGPMRRDVTASLGQTSAPVRFDVHAEGLVLSVPGQSLSGFPSDPMTIMDRASNWKSSGRTTDYQGRCATQVTAPDGTKYKFGRHAYRIASPLPVPITFLSSVPLGVPNFSRGQDFVEREYAVYLVTEVQDIHGNWVHYEYTNNGELSRIDSSDGRSITIQYNSTAPNANIRNSRTISSITVNTSVAANNRRWTYSYVQSPGNPYLRRVNLPDGRFWQFGTSQFAMRDMTTPVNRHYKCVPAEYSVSIKHPDGAIGSFAFRETRHIKNAETVGSADDDSDHWMLAQTIPNVSNNNECVTQAIADKPDFYRPPGWPVYRVMSVVSKSLSGQDIPTANWRFSYRNYGGGTLAYNYTKIVRPDGTEQTLIHPSLGKNHGLLTQVVTREAGHINDRARFIDRVDYTYNDSSPVFPECKAGGSFGDTSGMCHAFKMRPVSRIVQTRVENSSTSDFYTTEITYNKNGAGNFIDFGYPNKERRYSSITGSTTARETITSYEHKTSANIIGLTKRVVQNGREMATFSYNSLGQLESQTRYGQQFASFTYHTNSLFRGAIATSTDAVGREIFRTNYKRGIPQSTRRPDNRWLYVAIDDNGWLTSSTDAKGETTAYQRDNMGRLTLINPPGNWDNTSVSYNFNGGGAVQTITRGQSRETISYDQLYRPILERRHALDTGWSSYINTEYHPAGQVKFTSQPSSLPYESKGVNYSYDGLGRISTEEENVSPFATISHTYPGGNGYKITDAKSHATVEYRDGYAGAGQGSLIRISQPMGVNTVLYRNIWGQVNRIQQIGNVNGYNVNQSQYNYYDVYQRLCRHRTPEGGDTLYAYDASGYLTSYAKGMNFGTNCAAPSGASKVTLTLDSLARVTKTDFANAATPDIIKTYDFNGNVLSNYRAGVNWTYTYDQRNHLTSESLGIDGRDYNLSYIYDASENLVQRTLPSGRVVTYSHDGLGREISATSFGKNYADKINYHINNVVSSMTYGNGQVFTQTLNARLLPERLRSIKGSTTALDLNYTYDSRRSINRIADATNSSNTKDLAYDDLGRLLTANGPWGTGQFVYDALGNLRYKVLGSRNINISYNASNQASRNTDSSGSARNIGYDSRGNVTSLGDLTFNYDYSDQPISVSGSVSGAYEYDGNMKRVKASVDGKTIYNIYDASGSLVHVDKVRSSGTSFIRYKNYLIPISKPEKTDYIKVAGMTVARLTNDVPTYLHPNLIGSAVSGTDSSGIVVWNEAYTPFGEKLNENDVNDNLGSFTGHIEDSETGLTYMQARYYDPVIGRFLSVDPVGFKNVRNFNRYAYANNNPYNYIDPDGRDTRFIGGAGVDGGYINDMARAFTSAGISNVTTATSENASTGSTLTDALSVMMTNNVREGGDFTIQTNLAEGEQLNLVGYSWGGIVAAQRANVAAKNGQTIDNLVLIGAPINADLLSAVENNENILNVKIIDLTAKGDPIFAGMSDGEIAASVPTLIKQQSESSGHFFFAPNTDEGASRRDKLAEELVNSGLE